jgi:hypothetical protein
VQGLGLDERRLDRRRVGDVAAQVERPRRAAAGARGDGDVVAEREERLGDRPPDATVAAGDQDRPGRRRPQRPRTAPDTTEAANRRS